MCHPGFQASNGLDSIQVAKPSFSQMSSHHAIVTRSPNHWCAISWEITEPISLYAQAGAFFSFSRSKASRKVIAAVFSIAPAAKSGRPMRSNFSNGYLMPK